MRPCLPALVASTRVGLPARTRIEP